MQVYRLTRQRYAGSLSGKGAALYPGRWNTVGQETIYTATSRALALVEILAHLPRSLIPRDFILQTIDIPDDQPIRKMEWSELPEHWDQKPAGKSSQAFGSALLERHLLVLAPSAIVTDEWNLLINPLQDGFHHISLLREEPFPLDTRLVQRGI